MINNQSLFKENPTKNQTTTRPSVAVKYIHKDSIISFSDKANNQKKMPISDIESVNENKVCSISKFF